MSHKGQKRSERSELRPFFCEVAGYRSSMTVPCLCMGLAVPHSATLQLVVNRKVKVNGHDAAILGYDGQCRIGTRASRTWLEANEETQPDKNGEVRTILVRRIQPYAMREMSGG